VVNATLLDGLDQQLERFELDARQTLRTALGNAACDLDLIYGRSPGHIVATRQSPGLARGTRLLRHGRRTCT
jgi:hypothetical protein